MFSNCSLNEREYESLGVGWREGQEFRVTSGSLIAGSESLPSLGRRQSRGRPGVSGLGVLCLRGRPPGAVDSLGQELGERSG